MGVLVFKITRLKRIRAWPQIKGKSISFEIIEKLKKKLGRKKIIRIGDFDLPLEPFDSLDTLDMLVRKKLIKIEVFEKGFHEKYPEELDKVECLE